jgi:hypothetical protein
MKKFLITAVITSLISGAAFAATNVVSSANVVGYSKVTLQPGFNIMRTPFVNGTNFIDIQSVMDTSTLKQGPAITSADSIQFWDTGTLQYVRYFVHDGSGKNNAAKAGKWINNATGLIASNVVPPTAGFFFSSISTSNTDAFVAGDVVVSTTGTNTLALVEGFNLVANPFSCDWALNNYPTNYWITQGAKAGPAITSADSIQFWDNNSLAYKRYYLHDGTGKNNAQKYGKWIDNTSGNIASNLNVEISQGFFYSRVIGQSNITIEIAQPYTLQ